MGLLNWLFRKPTSSSTGSIQGDDERRMEQKMSKFGILPPQSEEARQIERYSTEAKQLAYMGWGKENIVNILTRSGCSDKLAKELAQELAQARQIERYSTEAKQLANDGWEKEKIVNILTRRGCSEKLAKELVYPQSTAPQPMISNGLKDSGTINELRRKVNESRWQIKTCGDAEMVSYLQKLCNAYIQNNSKEAEQLEPIATAIGEELNDRGGIAEMRRIFAKLGGIRGSRTLEMHWDGIGDWRG